MRKQLLAIIPTACLLAVGLLLISPRHVGAGSGTPNTVTVEIHNFAFQPANVTVHPGDIVEWKNEDDVAHTATATTPKPGFDTGSIQPGGARQYKAQQEGTYNYICTIHPYMKGTLIVQ